MTVVEASDTAAVVIAGATNAIVGARTWQHINWYLDARDGEFRRDVPVELSSEVLGEIDKSMAAASTVPIVAGSGFLPFALRDAAASRGR